MDPQPQPLLLPLTFPTISNLGHRVTKTQNLVETSCSTAAPSVLLSWGLSHRRFDAEDSGGGLPANGAVMGCNDGTLYIFLSTPNSEDFEPSGSSSEAFAPKSPPLTVTDRNSNLQRLSLRCHIIPPRSRPGNAITGMQLIDHNRLLVTLRAQG